MKTTLLFMLALASAPAWASDVFIQLDSSTINAAPGDTITFSGVITNEDNFVIDLNSIDVTLNGMFSVDTSPFFSGPVSIDAPPGVTQTVDFQLFSVTVAVPYTDLPGIQTGTVTILGNVETNGMPDYGVLNPLGSATFGVNVSQVPEPSTFAMIGSVAIVGGLLFFRRKQRLRSQS